MQTTTPPGPAEPTSPAAPPPARRSWASPGRLLNGAVVVASFGLWVFALARIGVKDPPDTLADAAFPAAAEPRCAAAVADIATLPAASTARSAAERAVTLDQATDRLDSLYAELVALAPDTGPDAATLEAWLADWKTYLGDRRDYATRLRQDERAEFQLTLRAGQDVTRPLDNLAIVNHMPSCATPGDVG